MTTNATTIRPGYLINLSTKLTGGVTYRRTDLDADGFPVAEGAAVARWETTRIIDDEDEHARAIKARSAASGLIRKCCQETSFGLLCPEDQIGALDAALVDARKLVDAFNATAATCQIGLYVLKGRVASNDAEAARAITAEIADLVTQMDRGIATLDSAAIRKAADRAREVGAMLDERVKGKLDAAIEQARKAARTIVKRIEKEGEDKAIVMMDIQRGQIESARIAFLDMSNETGAPVEALPVVHAQRFADLDTSAADEQSGERAPVTRPAALDFDDSEIKLAARSANVPAMELV